MSIKRKLLLASMALAAIAFAVPAGAQAQTHGLTENGAFIKAGAQVTMTSFDFQALFSGGKHRCSTVTLHYEVFENTEEHIVLVPLPEATKNGAAKGCVFISNTGIEHSSNIPTIGTHAVTLNLWGTGTTEVVLVTERAVPCSYKGVLHFQLREKPNELLIVSSELTGGLCGTLRFEAAGPLETSDGTPLVADIKAT